MSLSVKAQENILLSYVDEIIDKICQGDQTNVNSLLSDFISSDVIAAINQEQLSLFHNELKNCEQCDNDKIVESIYKHFRIDDDNQELVNKKNDGQSDDADGSAITFLQKTKNVFYYVNKILPALTEKKNNITGILEKFNLYSTELLKLFNFLQNDNIEDIYKKEKCFISSEILAIIYSNQDNLLNQETIENIKKIEQIINDEENKKFIVESLKDHPNKRIIFVIINYFAKHLNLETKDFRSESLLRFLAPSHKNKNQKDEFRFDDLLEKLSEKSNQSIITDTGHEKISEGLIDFFFGKERFQNDKDCLKVIKQEYKVNREKIHNFLTKQDANVIDFILNLLNSKSLSVFIIESLTAKLGYISDDSTNEAQQSFNTKLMNLIHNISENILIQEDKTAVDLWKLQLIRIFKAFQDRPGGLPDTAKAYIEQVDDDEIVTSLEFINKLTGFYISLQSEKKEPIDEIFTWLFTLHQSSHGLIEIQNELTLHNQILANQFKALIFGLTSIVLIISISILIAYKSWLIFGLMILSTLITSLLSLMWFYLIESSKLNPKSMFVKTLKQKSSLFKQLNQIMNEEKNHYSSFAHNANQLMLELLENLEMQLTFLAVRMPTILASTLMGLSYGIAISIPIWAYSLNIFQIYCMVPAILIAGIATICYKWANIPIAHEIPKIVKTNNEMQLKSASLFSHEQAKFNKLENDKDSLINKDDINKNAKK
ncbi:MAG: hypothetical protein VX835_01795 [Pseudomonadota bacterium]|nr:hypothetical protein [Pseudomonadota bacterium]